MSHRHATGKNSHRRCSWAANHEATYPIGSHFGRDRTEYAGLLACRPPEGALLVGSACRVGSLAPRLPIAGPSALMDSSFETGFQLTSLRTPLPMGYSL